MANTLMEIMEGLLLPSSWEQWHDFDLTELWRHTLMFPMEFGRKDQQLLLNNYLTNGQGLETFINTLETYLFHP